jgi:hypothetical protein
VGAYETSSKCESSWTAAVMRKCTYRYQSIHYLCFTLHKVLLRPLSIQSHRRLSLEIIPKTIIVMIPLIITLELYLPHPFFNGVLGICVFCSLPFRCTRRLWCSSSLSCCRPCLLRRQHGRMIGVMFSYTRGRTIILETSALAE